MFYRSFPGLALRHRIHCLLDEARICREMQMHMAAKALVHHAWKVRKEVRDAFANSQA